MSKVGTWSTTAGNNNATPPDGWPENQLPSTVNDCAREMMAALATYIRASEYVDLNNTPSFLTTTTFSLAAADSTNFEIGRRIKLFDATTLYGTIISNSGTFVQVRLDSGVLTASLSSVAVSAVRNTNNSLPANAFRNQNLVINGKLDIWQRGTSFSAVPTSNTWTMDRFVLEHTPAASHSMVIQKSERSAGASNVPSLAQTGLVLNNSILFTNNSAQASLSATAYSMLSYRMEGYDLAQIAHKPFGISFWVKSNRSGTYSCAIRGAGYGVAYIAPYTVSTINTWQRVYVPVPAPPTTGTWNYSTGVGLAIGWVLAAGASWQQTANEWTAPALLCVAGQTNLCASAGNTFSLANIELHEGLADVPTEIRHVAAELVLCYRYFEIGTSTVWYYSSVAGQEQRGCVQYKTTKRITPSVSLTSVNPLNVASVAVGDPTSTKFDHIVISTTTGYTYDATASFVADAEL